ncbi:MAG: ABC transporter ATP-binding protein [Acidobacteria bacterium]|nr:ABC transporter ATP-binding protein [Acidobacteriota bacterium]
MTNDGASNPSPAIIVSGLSKTYHPQAGPVPVFDGIDMSVATGEMLAVMGPSGAGKSTLLHLIGGLDTPDRGRVEIFGSDLSKLSHDARAEYRNGQIGFVFQFHFLLPEFTALENVMLPAMIAGRGKGDAAAAAMAELQAVGLVARAHHRPSELSGGEQQRVAIARALIMRPRLLLADEPTGNLDSRTSHAVMDTIQALHASQSLTTVLVTHNERLAERCGRRLVLEDGGLREA